MWRFDRDPRFSRRVRPWKAGAEGLDGDDLADLEPGDTLLAWGTGAAVRYCHFAEQSAVEAQFRGLPLRALSCYQADGSGDHLNDYYVFGRPEASVEVPRGTC